MYSKLIDWYNFSAKIKFIKIGPKLCSYTAVSHCNKRIITKYTAKFSGIVFTKEELATSSLTGSQSNANKKSTASNAPNKLNPESVAITMRKSCKHLNKSNLFWKLFKISAYEKLGAQLNFIFLYTTLASWQNSWSLFLETSRITGHSFELSCATSAATLEVVHDIWFFTYSKYMIYAMKLVCDSKTPLGF